MLPITALFALAATGVIGVSAETHTVHFVNNCGFGTPTLVQGTTVLSTGGDFTIDGPLIGAIAYLQTGGCGLDGEGCTVANIDTSAVPQCSVPAKQDPVLIACGTDEGIIDIIFCD